MSTDVYPPPPLLHNISYFKHFPYMLLDFRTFYSYLKPHYFNCKNESFAISELYYKIRCYNLTQNTLVKFYTFYNFTLFSVERKNVIMSFYRQK